MQLLLLVCVVICAGVTSTIVTAAPGCGALQVHAHRGVAEFPENSLRSLKGSLTGTYDAFETDIQVLKTGEWVVHHDPWTGRVVSGLGITPIANVNGQQWTSAALKERNGTQSVDHPIFLTTLLNEVKNLVTENRRANIEIKGSFSCASIRNAWYEIQSTLPANTWFITSVDQNALTCLRELDANQYLGVIVAPDLTIRKFIAKTQWSTIGEKFLKKAEEKYNQMLNREFLSTEGVGKLKSKFGNAGLHAEVTSLNPQVMVAAQALSVPVFSYLTDGNDTTHALHIRALKKQTSYLPTGAIIDGDPATFCGTVLKGL